MEDKCTDPTHTPESSQRQTVCLPLSQAELLPREWTGCPAAVGAHRHELVEDGDMYCDRAEENKEGKSTLSIQSQQTLSSFGYEPCSKSDETLQHKQMMADIECVGKLKTPTSPTQQCHIPEEDKSHISLALMECEVGYQEGEEIFRVQKHEMVCAVLSQTRLTDKNGGLISSLDIGLYWCNFCPFSTASKSLLVQHVVQHRFHCKHCRYQSFSRADVMHHSVQTHPYCQDSVTLTKYCALLSDYLRVQCLRENNGDQCVKRKTPMDDIDYQPTAKASREEDRGKQSSMGCETFSSEGDGVRKDGNRVPAEDKSDSYNATVLSSAFPTSPVDQIAVGTSDDLSISPDNFAEQWFTSDGQGPLEAQVKPPVLASEARAEDSQCQQDPSPISSQAQVAPALNSCAAGEDITQDVCTNTYFGCSHCKFTTPTKREIDRHLVQQHNGKPHYFVSLMKLEDKHTPPALSVSAKMECPDQKMVHAADESAPTENQGKAEFDKRTSECDEPPILFKQEPLDVEKQPTKRVHIPSLHIHKKHTAPFKCYHCDFRARYFGSLRCHILDNHKGKCLVGLGGSKSKIFMCADPNCSFRSWSGQKFLSHARTCTPWTQHESVYAPAEPHLLDSLHATMCLAEVPLSSSSVTVPKKLNGGKYSCLYCKNQFTDTKRHTKRHVIKHHGSQCLLMRNVQAHSKRRRSSVFFCRWCPWEGERKADHDLHAVFCPHQVALSTGHDKKSQSEADCDREDADVFEGNVDVASQVKTDETGDDDVDDGDDVNSLEPPDIVHDQEHLNKNHEEDHEVDDVAVNGGVCGAMPHDSVVALHEDAAFGEPIFSHAGTASSDIVSSAESAHANGITSLDKIISTFGSGLECLKCGMHLDSLGHLREHMWSNHSQHASFPFRSVYHKEKHNKSKFYACPALGCPVYKYSEADTVNHYRLHHSSQPHPYLDPGYSPAPVVFRRRSKLCPLVKGSSKLNTTSASRIPHVQMDASEKPFLCLYCERYFYTDTVNEMKAHHLLSHPGQPITVRDVKAFRYKKASRLAVCDQPQCDFTTYKPEHLAYHVAAQHSSQPPEMRMAERSFQCVSCGWITTDDSIVQEHVSMMHEAEGGATVVTLAHGDDQGTVEERFICAGV